MTIRDIEAIATLKILAAVARADGTVHNDERKSLAAALESLVLEKPIPVDELLSTEKTVDVSAELERLEFHHLRAALGHTLKGYITTRQ